MQEAAAQGGQLTDVASTDVVTSAEFRPARQTTAAFSAIDIQPVVLQPPFSPRSDGRYHVDDLLKYHDRKFIQNAYRAILKRGPDAIGYNAFIESLRSARLNKIDILARLRYSAEGRAKKVEIDGLLLPATIRKAYRVPVVGYFLHLAVAIARLPMTIRAAQQFEAHVLAQQELIAENLNHVGRGLRLHAQEVSQVLERRFELLKERDQHMQQLLEQLQQQNHEVGKRIAAVGQQGHVVGQRIDEVGQRVDAVEQQSYAVGQRIDEVGQRFDQVGQRLDEGEERTEQARERLAGEIDQTRLELGALAKQQQLARDEIMGLLLRQTKEAEARLERLAGEFEILAGQLSSGLEARLQDETTQRQQELWALGKRVGEVTSQGQEEARALETRIQQGLLQALQLGRGELRALEARVQEGSAAQREHTETTSRTLKGELDRVFQKQQQVTTELVLQGERLARLLAEARQRLPAMFDETQLRAIAGEADHTLDAFYASFDEQFRGSRDEIKKRMRVYLPLLKQQGIGIADMPILDAGCGRGEWLELLQEENLQGTGVDSNRVLVSQCVEQGLSAVEDDLMIYLKRLDDASLGSVTGFHIIEHLPIETLVEFLDETVRVVKPGGVVIFETPNPQNVLVGSCNFYFDPTHRNPLPSQVMKFLLESRGFVGVSVLNLNPSDDTPVADDSELARRFNQYFYGPMDYAVVGRKAPTMDGRP